MRRQAVPVLLLSLLLSAANGEARAGRWFHRGREGTPPPGAARQFEHSDARAGDPRALSPHAIPTNGPSYQGYYVGGGSPWSGGPRQTDEGTWGWDYVGTHLPRNVFLGWNHGQRYQGGTGSYKTDR